jgi:galactokinase
MPSPSIHDKVSVAYKQGFGNEPLFVVNTPGRVNLIGEHTDYNGGWVLPFAIDRSIAMAVGRSPHRSRLLALDRGETVEFDSNALPPPRAGHWSNYPIGVMDRFRGYGHPLPQVQAVFAGTIPQGGGLSSSAALANCMALAMDRLMDTGLPRETLALHSQAAENDYAGVRCGIMDQFATLLCKEGNGLLLDCRSLDYRHVPLKIGACRFILCNSMVKHDLATSGYNDRRKECEEALSRIRQAYPDAVDLRDCTPAMLDASRNRLTDVEYRRVLHQVGENRRVLEAVPALHSGNVKALGRLMTESHASLAVHFEVTSTEQDYLVEAALAFGALGARMTGGGFGGNVICLVPGNRVEGFATDIRDAYRNRFGLEAEILECRPSDGARVDSLEEAALLRP